MDTLQQLTAGQLKGKSEIHLNCGLTEFPLALLDLADSLEILDLSGNHLTTLPDSFSQLRRLKIAFFNNNAFTDFPEVLAHCPALSMVGFKNNQLQSISEQALSHNIRWLILTNNQLEQLPSSIGQLSKLQKLMLAGNRLKALPPELANCQNLELIRLSENKLQHLPGFLFQLPRLAWLAYSGNAFNRDAKATSSTSQDLATISPSELDIQEILGEGASGVIHKATWTPAAAPDRARAAAPSSTPSTPPTPSAQTVALKKFKGEITSDGSPLDEMSACIAAGAHPNLIKVLGQYTDQEEQQQTGLVFSFISNNYINLGNPPSLETCTRDTYPDDTSFTLKELLTITQGIASVAAHLHQRGISHGDLYAHNILVNAAGHSILGDFGAASFYPPTDTPLAQSIERLEVRAFGCLLEDLLAHARASSRDELMVFQSLKGLQQDCMKPVPSERPLFQKICDRLSYSHSP